MASTIREINCCLCQNKSCCPLWKETKIDQREKTEGSEAEYRTLMDIGNIQARGCNKYQKT
jgi:hypothetical protein